jgi:hypothetical protein
VVDDAPRLTSVEFVPHIAKRGDLIIVNAIAFDGHGVESVQVDMRVFGGQLIDLILLENDVWAGNFTLPNGMTPGSHDIPFIVTDSIGGKQILRHWINIDNGAQPNAATPYRLPDAEHVSTTITVQKTNLTPVATVSVSNELASKLAKIQADNRLYPLLIGQLLLRA